MDCLEFKNKCRICLKDDADIYWDNVLYEYSNLTYKDCYYKYTNLECFDVDNFSQLLCHSCSEGLEYVDTFITKALDTHLVLDNYRLSMTIKDDCDVIENETTEFEEIFIEETKPEIKSFSTNENLNEELPTIPQNTKTSRRSKRSIGRLQKQQKKSIKSKKTTNKTEELKNLEDELIGQEIITELKVEFLEDTSQPDDNKNSRKLEKICCSICPKILTNKYKAILHEKTHLKNRERNETCDICGLKFYTKRFCKSHMLTHLENREKPHKCEYCDKAFYNKGSLNVHRRLHLDQMISCSFCTKKFYRQIDLDKHMYSHSAARINSNAKQKTKRYFRCKDCGKNVRTNSFNSHIAEHMNEPLFKCSICNKEFFKRDNCFSHLKKFHKKPSVEVANFIIAYKQNRLSHLYLEQKDIEVITK